MIICGTGHRPNKLGGYTKAIENSLIEEAKKWLSKNKPNKVISGMALGWDQALAVASTSLNIHTIAAVPFPNHHVIWPHWQIDKYTELLTKCNEIKIVCEGAYAPWKMQKRNEWMVDICDTVLALWDGSNGGTKNCIEYATEHKKPIINLWETYHARAKGIQV